MPWRTEIKSFTIPKRFCGPALCANGGWFAGAVSRLYSEQYNTGRAVRVTLRYPVPLDAMLRLDLQDDAKGIVLIEGEPSDHALAAVEQVDWFPRAAPYVQYSEAEFAATKFPSGRHPFPECFVCGNERTDNWGLGLRPGKVRPGTAASPWVPSERLAMEPLMRQATWAALDCPGGWAAATGEALVLGAIAAWVDKLPAVGERHVVVGQLLGKKGRKSHTVTSIFDTTGQLLAAAEAVWIAVDAKAFQG